MIECSKEYGSLVSMECTYGVNGCLEHKGWFLRQPFGGEDCCKGARTALGCRRLFSRERLFAILCSLEEQIALARIARERSGVGEFGAGFVVAV